MVVEGGKKELTILPIVTMTRLNHIILLLCDLYLDRNSALVTVVLVQTPEIK